MYAVFAYIKYFSKESVFPCCTAHACKHGCLHSVIVLHHCMHWFVITLLQFATTRSKAFINLNRVTVCISASSPVSSPIAINSFLQVATLYHHHSARLPFQPFLHWLFKFLYSRILSISSLPWVNFIALRIQLFTGNEHFALIRISVLTNKNKLAAQFNIQFFSGMNKV